MTLKTLISTVLAASALVFGVQAGWAISDASDRGVQAVAPDAFERAVAAKLASETAVSGYPDASQRSGNASLAQQSTMSRYPDAFERALSNRVQSGSPIGHVDRYELDLPNGPVTSQPTTTGRDIEWPQLGLGFGIGMVFVLGLILAVRLTRSRPLAHG